MLTRTLEAVDSVLRAVLALLLLVMVAAVTWQVVSRYLLDDPSSWTEELARFVLIWIGLLGGAHAYRRRLHLGLDLLAARLGGRARVLQTVVIHGVVAVFAVAWLGFTAEVASWAGCDVDPCVFPDPAPLVKAAVAGAAAPLWATRTVEAPSGAASMASSTSSGRAPRAAARAPGRRCGDAAVPGKPRRRMGGFRRALRGDASPVAHQPGTRARL